MDDDEAEALRLNTLHRFRKHSSRLLLEEYSHCEVPAGCGGVVLRWIDPGAGTPAIVRTCVEAKITLWLDGAQLDSSRVDLRAGVHTLALELAEIVQPKQSRLASMIRGHRPAYLLLSILRGLSRDREDARAVVLLRSQAGRAWRVLGEQPPSNWTAPEFDDSAWPVAQWIELDAEQREAWRAQQLLGHGALPIALPSERAWIRVRFEVPALQLEQEGA
jgi:hypothetical protein